jgi:hypothetical protein
MLFCWVSSPDVSKALWSFQLPGTIHPTAQGHIWEDLYLQHHSCENLKSYNPDLRLVYLIARMQWISRNLFTLCKAICINTPNKLGNFTLLMRHLILFQTYIEIFNKIEDVNLAALFVSSITIVALVINETLKVSTGQLSLFLCVTVCIYLFNGSYVCHF